MDTQSLDKVCKLCNKKFQTRSSLNRHNRQLHSLDPAPQSRKICSIEGCGEKFTSMNPLIEHLKDVHRLHVKWESFVFATAKDFQAWKCQVEEETDSFFVSQRTFIDTRGRKVRQFECNRSGFPDHKNKGKGGKARQEKAKGSCKIGRHCPAQIKCTISGDQHIVEFRSSHYGHELNPIHLRMSKKISRIEPNESNQVQIDFHPPDNQMKIREKLESAKFEKSFAELLAFKDQLIKLNSSEAYLIAIKAVHQCTMELKSLVEKNQTVSHSENEPPPSKVIKRKLVLPKKFICIRMKS